MNKTIKNVPTFRQGYEELYQLGCQTAVLMTTDSKEFEEFGIDQTRIAGLQNLCDSFNQRKVDEAYVLIQKLKTLEKYQAAQELMRTLYILETQVNLQWADLGFSFRSFKLGSISKDNELELLTKAKSIIKIMSEQAEIYVSTDLLDAVAQKIELFEVAIDAQKQANKQRHSAAKLRQAQAASFFAQIRKYRELGKRIWIIKGNKARSKDYVMPRNKRNSSLFSRIKRTVAITEDEVYDYSDASVESSSLVT